MWTIGPLPCYKGYWILQGWKTWTVNVSHHEMRLNTSYSSIIVILKLFSKCERFLFLNFAVKIINDFYFLTHYFMHDLLILSTAAAPCLDIWDDFVAFKSCLGGQPLFDYSKLRIIFPSGDSISQNDNPIGDKTALYLDNVNLLTLISWYSLNNRVNYRIYANYSIIDNLCMSVVIRHDIALSSLKYLKVASGFNPSFNYVLNVTSSFIRLVCLLYHL